MKALLLGFILALQFLTRIPIPIVVPWKKDTIKGALKSFSSVGLIIGGILTVLLVLTSGELPDWFSALSLLTLWVFLTGGLHLDGLMDVADAVGSNASVEKKLKIMKDPHVGSFAVLIVLFFLLWKFAMIYGLIDHGATTSLFIGLLLIPACSRLLALALLNTLPTIKQEGLAFTWKEHLSSFDLFFVSLPVLLFIGFYPVFIGLVLSYLILFIMIRVSIKRKFNGINGDLIGASIEGGELWGLVVLWLFISYGMV